MKNKKILVLIGVVVLIAVAIAAAVLVLTNKGHRVIKVESFSGKVALQRENSEKSIFKDMNLKSEDIITTGTDGLVGLLVDTDKNIAAVENTCFAIVSSGNEKKGALKIQLKYGTSLIEIKNKLSDGSSFKVETPNATLSVKGTAFEVTYTPEKKTTVLKVTQGSVQVDAKAKSDMVNAGKMAIIKDDNIEISEFADEDNKDDDKGDSNNNSDNTAKPSGTLNDEDFPKVLKGGCDYAQLQYMLEIVSRCRYNKEEDYLKDALYWMCHKTFGEAPINPVEKLDDGSEVYDVASLNEVFSFITNDTISEDNLNAGLNRLDGGKLICTKAVDNLDRIASAGIMTAYYSESNEIIVEYLFNVVHGETLEVERYEKKAHLIPAGSGKYAFGYIEDVKQN